MRTRRGTTIATAAATATALIGLAGCYSAPVMPPTGLVYSNVNAPESLSISGQEIGSRTGRSSATSILGLFAWGDASVHAAAAAGSIDRVQHVDYEFYNVIGVYQRFTTVAYGE